MQSGLIYYKSLKKQCCGYWHLDLPPWVIWVGECNKKAMSEDSVCCFQNRISELVRPKRGNGSELGLMRP